MELIAHRGHIPKKICLPLSYQTSIQGETMETLDLVRELVSSKGSAALRKAVDTLDTADKGTLKGWINNTGQGAEVNTVQLTIRDGEVVGAWQPGIRTLDMVRATGFALDGSISDFKGSRVLAASAGAIVYEYSWGESSRVVIHYTGKAPTCSH